MRDKDGGDLGMMGWILWDLAGGEERRGEGGSEGEEGEGRGWGRGMRRGGRGWDGMGWEEEVAPTFFAVI